jgi:ribosomal protein S18 acetylase RimI-like enzyme
VVRAGGRPVGAAFLVGHDDISVSVLAVDADHRRRGVARQLLAAARTTAHDRGAAQVRMTTDCNATALEIYQRLGMTVERTFTHWAVDVPPARRG